MLYGRPRIAVVTNGNYFANLALSTLLNQTSHDYDYLVVVTSGLRRHNGNRVAEAAGLFRRWGVRYSAYKLAMYVLPKVLGGVPTVGRRADQPAAPSHRRRSMTVAATCRELAIPVRNVRNVNDDPGATWLTEFAPDLLLSFSCPYRIRAGLLDLPSIGALNVHSSLLPQYAGVCTYVHVLADGRTATGVTVHEMVEEFDAGRVVAQTEIAIEPGTSVFALFSEQCRVAGGMLVDSIRDCVMAGKVPGHLQDDSRRTYFGEPTRADIARVRANGHRLLRGRDMSRLVRGAV